MINKIKTMIDESANTREKMHGLSSEIKKAADMMINSIRNGNKILVCGNGGSAAQAQHFSAELVGRFESERKAMAAISLTTDTSALTALGNDYGFDYVFKRQIEALGKSGDILFCLSTSGNSKNLIDAIPEARRKNLLIINLLGKDGGKMKGLGDIDIIVNSNNTARIQECHLLTIHMLAKLIEDFLSD